MNWFQILCQFIFNFDSVGQSMIEKGNEFQVLASETVKEDE